jgi:hypothetical protein
MQTYARRHKQLHIRQLVGDEAEKRNAGFNDRQVKKTGFVVVPS